MPEFEVNETELQTVIRAIVQRVLQERGLAGGTAPSGEANAPIRNEDASSTALAMAPSSELATSQSKYAGRVLVAVCCDECLNDEARAALAELKSARFLLTEPGEHEFKKREVRERLISKNDVVLMPAVHDDEVAKMALGIFDDPVARVALSTLALGKPLVAALHAPYDDMLKMHSPLLRRLFEGYRRALQNYGFELVECAQITSMVSNLCGVALRGADNGSVRALPSSGGKKQLITVREIEAAARSGRRLQLPPGALITPLARDRARELGLNLD
ncbi:MAG: hypothetical protein M3347_14815 [Armatimonadota bacterium]|nr:hypothetical protein [Armatimonadota bacterium]